MGLSFFFSFLVDVFLICSEYMIDIQIELGDSILLTSFIMNKWSMYVVAIYINYLRIFYKQAIGYMHATLIILLSESLPIFPHQLHSLHSPRLEIITPSISSSLRCSACTYSNRSNCLHKSYLIGPNFFISYGNTYHINCRSPYTHYMIGLV